ncbi:MAG: phosphatidylglycerophosphatase A [Bacteroidetes bacterium]|nr:MAG: phosphatidylglycerophosphatase A [Bacteroidota bacterium]
MNLWIEKSISTALGIGYLPLAPGTWASVLTVAAWYLMAEYFDPGFVLQLLIIAVIVMAGFYSVSKVQPEWGKDPSRVVIDEVAGMSIACFMIPAGILNYCIALALFRFFDIVKPLGIRKAEKLGGATGVMLDDIVAGIAANLLTLAIL